MISLYVLVQAIFTLSVAVAVGNNMGVILGPAIGARALKKEWTYLLSFTGLAAGYIIEGQKLELTSMSYSLDSTVIIYSLSLLILLILTLGGFVTSITQIFVGVFAGLSLVKGETFLIEKVETIIIFWVITLLASSFISYLIMRSLIRKGSITINNLAVLKMLLFIFVFFTAYVLGANTLGFISSFYSGTIIKDILVLIGIAVGIVIVKGIKGTKMLGSGFYGIKYVSAVPPYISALLMTEISTQLSVPLPTSLALFSGILGSGVAMGFRAISHKRVVSYILMSWVAPFLASLITSWIIFSILGY
jgi:PiT family inorganic phosphate transporter